MKISLCLIAAAFIGSSLFTMIGMKSTPAFKKFDQILTPEQTEIYNKIREERRVIHMQGVILGSLLAGAYLYLIQKEEQNTVRDSCVFVVIAMGITYSYYTLYPKSTYILNHLTEREQIDAWLETYKTARTRSYTGLVLGAVGYFLLSNGVLRD